MNAVYDNPIRIYPWRISMPEEREDKTIYKVVVNHEEQYSIWPAHRENALGWKDVGKSGTKEECLAYIKEVWTDIASPELEKEDAGAGAGLIASPQIFAQRD